MRTLSKCLAISAAAVVLVGAGLFWAARSQGRDAETRSRIEMLAVPAPAVGRNAFPALWTFGYRVPEDRIEAVASEDVERFRRQLADGTVPATAPGVVAAGRFDDLLAADGDASPGWCTSRETDCLQRVRADRDGFARRLEPLAPVLRQADALEGYGHYASGFPPHLHAPFPPKLSDAVRVPMTAHALAFVRGDTRLALAGVCRSVAGWRRLVPHSDSLVISMLAINAVDGYSRLFAGMLAELPADTVLPAECGAAFAPPGQGEIGVCAAVKGEFAMQRALIRDPSASMAMPWYHELAYDRDATEGQAAEFLSIGCDARGQALIAADRPVPPAPSATPYQFECLANVTGCLLASVATPDYARYLRRAQDHGMRLRLMATLLWLRENRGDRRPLATRLAARPAAMRSLVRAIELDDGGRGLRIALYEHGDDARWQVPLPPAL